MLNDEGRPDDLYGPSKENSITIKNLHRVNEMLFRIGSKLQQTKLDKVISLPESDYNSWHHIIMKINVEQTNISLNVWYDGVNKGTSTGTFTFSYADRTTNAIGLISGYTKSFNSWSRLLSDSEITKRYNDEKDVNIISNFVNLQTTMTIQNNSGEIIELDTNTNRNYLKTYTINDLSNIDVHFTQTRDISVNEWIIPTLSGEYPNPYYIQKYNEYSDPSINGTFFREQFY